MLKLKREKYSGGFMYYKLDLEEFFKDEYRYLNNNKGIGAKGIITSKQIINVYNDYALDEKTNKMYLGLGDHIDIQNSLLDLMYGNHLESNLNELISISYRNHPFSKMICIFIPKNLTVAEYKNLRKLLEQYSLLFNKYEITIGCSIYGDNVFEYGPAVELKNKIDPILDYAEERIDKTLVRKKEEKILKI